MTGFVNSQVLCCCPRAIKEGNRTNKNRESYLDLEIFASVLSLYAMAIRGPLSFHLWISVSLMLLMYGDCFYLPGVAPEDFKKVRFCCWLSTFYVLMYPYFMNPYWSCWYVVWPNCAVNFNCNVLLAECLIFQICVISGYQMGASYLILFVLICYSLLLWLFQIHLVVVASLIWRIVL